MTQSEAQIIALQELSDGEEILWCGFADPKRAMRRMTFVFLIGVIGVTGVICGICQFLSQSHTNWPHLSLWVNIVDATIDLAVMAMCFLVGFLMLASPLIAYLAAQKTVYAITNQHIVVIRRFRGHGIESCGLESVKSLSRVDLPNGCGDLTLTVIRSTEDESTHSNTIDFLGIPDVRSVEQLIHDRFMANS